MRMKSSIVLVALCGIAGVPGVVQAQILFGPAVQTPSGPAQAVASGDFDGDGTRDVAILRYSSGAFALMRNSGAGVFSNPTLHQLGSATVNGIVSGDFDGDGDLDVAGSGSNTFGGPVNAEITVARNNGDGTFLPPVSSPLPIGASGLTIVAAHLNPGNALDIVICEPSSNWNRVQVMINTGGGSFIAGAAITLTNAYHAQAADLDGDGDNDLVIAQRGVGPTFWVYKNNGQGLFSSFGQTSVPIGGDGPHGLACGDVDGDGDIDVVADRYPVNPGPPGVGGTVMVLRNNGTGVLAVPLSYPAGGNVQRVVLADFDGDGAMDVAVTESLLSGVHFLRNQGGGIFAIALFRNAGFSDHLAADFDGDGDPDVVSVGIDEGELSFLRNLDPPAAFGPYPGTAEDLQLLTGVNGTPTTGPGLTIKSARAGDHLGVRLVSPGGGFTGDPFFIAGELFPTGAPPGSPPGLPMIHLGGPGLFILVSSTAGPFTLGVPAGGFHLLLIVPPGLAGQSAMLQAAAFSPAAANAFFAATDAHEIRFVP